MLCRIVKGARDPSNPQTLQIILTYNINIKYIDMCVSMYMYILDGLYIHVYVSTDMCANPKP